MFKPPKFYVESLAIVLGTRLARVQFGSESMSARAHGNVPLAIWERVKDHVARHHARQIYMRDLARVAGLSEFYFYRQFYLAFNMTPRDYVMHYRTQKAEELILTRELSPKQAAREAGFRQPAHFYRRYRALRGFPPRLLLKQPRV